MHLEPQAHSGGVVCAAALLTTFRLAVAELTRPLTTPASTKPPPRPSRANAAISNDRDDTRGRPVSQWSIGHRIAARTVPSMFSSHE